MPTESARTYRRTALYEPQWQRGLELTDDTRRGDLTLQEILVEKSRADCLISQVRSYASTGRSWFTVNRVI